jgi:putative endonuclease
VTRFGRRAAAPGHDRRVLGRRGERLAARALRRRGFRILARNLTVGRDEADLVALDPDGATVVIVEVKTRRDADTPPEASINHHKQQRLARLAAILQRSGTYAGRPMRFDAVAVHFAGDARPEIRHYEGAFESPF